MEPGKQGVGQPGKIEELAEHIKEYADTRYELFMLKTTDKISSWAGTLLTCVMVIFFSLLVLVMLGIGASLWISEAMGDGFSGFFIVSGFYFVLMFVLYRGRDALIKKPVIHRMIVALDEMLSKK